MKKLTWQVAFLLLLLVILTILAWKFIEKPTFKDEEIHARIAQIYGGDVQNIVKGKTYYTISFSRPNEMYEIDMHKKTGAFQNLQILFKAPVDGANELSTLLTLEEATKIATNKYFGTPISTVYNEESFIYVVVITTATQRYTISIDGYNGDITSVVIDSQ